MKLEDKRTYLKEKGFKQTNYFMYFIPPNLSEWKNERGDIAHIEEWDEGGVVINGLDAEPNDTTVQLFSFILSRDLHL